MKKLFISCVMLGVAICHASAQNRTISGRIIYDQFEPVTFAYIMINDTVKVGASDLNGYFRVEIPTAEKKIKLLAVGFDALFIGLNETCDDLEVVMTQRPTACFDTPRKVEKLRKQRFMDAVALHKAAYEKGIFKNSSPCYDRLYIKE